MRTNTLTRDLCFLILLFFSIRNFTYRTDCALDFIVWITDSSHCHFINQAAGVKRLPFKLILVCDQGPMILILIIVKICVHIHGYYSPSPVSCVPPATFMPRKTPAFNVFFKTTAATISTSPFLMTPGAFKSGR